MKPSNILIGADGVVKLADFGIARAADLTRLTGSSTMLGTPAYMAPEGQEDERSDLYSVGCVLYEALTGSPPFTGDSQQKIMARHIREAPDLSKLPVEARRICGLLLEKKPKKRPESASTALSLLAKEPSSTPLAKALHFLMAMATERSGRAVLVRAVALLVPTVAAWWIVLLASGSGPPATVSSVLQAATEPERPAVVVVSPTATPSRDAHLVAAGETCHGLADEWAEENGAQSLLLEVNGDIFHDIFAQLIDQLNGEDQCASLRAGETISLPPGDHPRLQAWLDPDDDGVVNGLEACSDLAAAGQFGCPESERISQGPNDGRSAGSFESAPEPAPGPNRVTYTVSQQTTDCLGVASHVVGGWAPPEDRETLFARFLDRLVEVNPELTNRCDSLRPGEVLLLPEEFVTAVSTPGNHYALGGHGGLSGERVIHVSVASERLPLVCEGSSAVMVLATGRSDAEVVAESEPVLVEGGNASGSVAYHARAGTGLRYAGIIFDTYCSPPLFASSAVIVTDDYE